MIENPDDVARLRRAATSVTSERKIHGWPRETRSAPLRETRTSFDGRLCNRLFPVAFLSSPYFQ